VHRSDQGVIDNLVCELWRVEFVLWGDEARCSQLEYRQYFRSAGLRMSPPKSLPMTLKVATDWEEAEAGQWRKVENHNAEDWIEDTKAEDPAPKIGRYGYRVDDRRVQDGRFPRDQYEDAWIYRATDEPNLNVPAEFGLQPGTRFQIDARFKGQIVDVASGKVVVESPEWFWQFDGD
jgi:hypothetical protein